MISGGLDQKINIWDVNSSRDGPVSSIANDQSTNGSIYALASSPDGLIVTGSPDKIVRGWDVRGTRTQALIGHTDVIRDLLISEDGKWVLSASSDGTVKLWSVAMPNRCVTTYTHSLVIFT